jgi:L-threonylcarbamoyladenylate synthase
MDARHYAPRARLQLVSASALRATVEALVAAGRRVGVVFHAAPAFEPDPAARVLVRRLANEPDAYASRLYATLHDLDDCAVEDVVVEAVPEGEAWWAVADRLRRAAASE